jgi:hypothetical protein
MKTQVHEAVDEQAAAAERGAQFNPTGVVFHLWQSDITGSPASRYFFGGSGSSG